MLTRLFADLAPQPDDPILGLNVIYRDDPRPEKVNLGVGVYLTDEGKIPLLSSVAEAERRMLERRQPHGYGPMEGLPPYCTAVKKLVFGEKTEGLERITTIQTLGGTGALQLGAAFAKSRLGLSESVVSNPTWGNHVSILSEAGLAVGRYAYYDAAANAVDFDALMADLKSLPAKTLVLMHACCHNPTGVDLTEENWRAVLEVVRERDLFPFLDMAYQGFGRGLEEDPYALRLFLASGVNFMAATSSSKNFGLYGERAGALHVVAETADEARTVESILKNLVRAEYSNPPFHGAAIVSEVLGDPELAAAWREEVKTCRERILAMREALSAEGERLGADLSFARRQCGMFSFTGFTKEEMVRLRTEFAIYGVENGRINVAGLSTRNVKYVAEAFAKVKADR